MTLAPEGKKIYLSAFILTVLLTVLGWWLNMEIFKMLVLPSFLFLLMCFVFFRDPVRKIPEGENLILSPADGKIVFSGETEIGGEKVKLVSIFLSLFNVHVNRVPVDGKVSDIKYHRGKFHAAFKKNISEINERTEINIIHGEKSVKVKQIAGILARRIICHLKKEDTINKGDRLGFILFGSRTDLILPVESLLHVKVGDRVKATETIIGKL
jgi:phosphatidylserine decarboxylase|tara:strand:- start:1818 stop:2453 length:636 start_codon:yes stop_codon:yes gene_type:complete